MGGLVATGHDFPSAEDHDSPQELNALAVPAVVALWEQPLPVARLPAVPIVAELPVGAPPAHRSFAAEPASDAAVARVAVQKVSQLAVALLGLG